MSLRFTDWVIEEQERAAMTDDEKMLTELALSAAKEDTTGIAFGDFSASLADVRRGVQLLRAVRELEAWVQTAQDLEVRVEFDGEGASACAFNKFSPLVATGDEMKTEDAIIALAARIRDGQEG